MTEIPTIGGLLDKANAQFRVFDMGRRVTKLPRALFSQVEEGERPYPYPLQQQAWLGILFWDKDQPKQHFVWFLCFPLDEMGQLQFAARDEFLESVLHSLGNPQNPDSTGIEEAHQESPFAFKPREERLAAFHANALQMLKLPPSSYYAHAREYLSGDLGYEQWAFLGLQGVADVVTRRDQEGNASLLSTAIPQLPSEPLVALCQLLENNPLQGEVAAVLQRLLEGRLSDPEAGVGEIAALVRSLGATDLGHFRHQAYHAVLESDWGRQLDVLVAISGRGWEALRDADLRLRFLERLAECDVEESVFSLVLGDLLFIPGMRPMLMESFRSRARSELLIEAIGKMMRGISD